MAADKRKIQVFIASPGDLADERRAFRTIVEELNLGFGDGAGVEFVPLGWEDTLASTGRRPQSVINADVDSCDIFILTLYRRWGQDAPDSEYSSYTEEEFHRALARFGKDRTPEIFVFFKDVESGQIADPGPELLKVLQFRRALEESRTVLYRRYASTPDFRREVDRHLRAYVKGDLPDATEPTRILLPIEYIERLDSAERTAREEIERAEAADRRAEAEAARAEALAFEVARRALDAAREGRTEEAWQDFSKATAGSTSLPLLLLASLFFERAGGLAQAEDLLRRALAIVGPGAETLEAALVASRLGHVLRLLGKLAEAEAMHRRALALHEQAGRLDGVAVALVGLGNVVGVRQRLDEAESLYRRAIEVNEKLGRKEGLAASYGNLGNILFMRGRYEDAERMYRLSLQFEQELGNGKGIARALGNIGKALYALDDFKGAEELLLEALARHEGAKNLESMAVTLGNLGALYRAQRRFDEAEASHRRALAINEQTGRIVGVAESLGNLGNVLADLRRLDEAAAVQQRALEIDKLLDRPLALANDYTNLARTLFDQGNLQGARDALERSVAIREKKGGDPKALEFTLKGLEVVLERVGDTDALKALRSRLHTLQH